jgi:hypothetical protein
LSIPIVKFGLKCASHGHRFAVSQMLQFRLHYLVERNDMPDLRRVPSLAFKVAATHCRRPSSCGVLARHKECRPHEPWVAGVPLNPACAERERGKGKSLARAASVFLVVLCSANVINVVVSASVPLDQSQGREPAQSSGFPVPRAQTQLLTDSVMSAARPTSQLPN